MTHPTAPDVSRETMAQLRDFEQLVSRWTTSINLIAKSTRGKIWERHILDSLHLLPHLKSEDRHVLDLGSGGGFPGLVLAIADQDKRRFTLVESDRRKASFLQTAVNRLALSAVIETHRIEDLDPLFADVITARAFAPLRTILDFGYIHLAGQGHFLLLKGKDAETEIAEAKSVFEFDLTRYATDQGTVLDITSLRKRA